ncbi:MAG: hypothetical protein IJS22_03455 [Lachnospiraceae bacterium]|nr:hypothetical protein [Lachnospiraceae bacterium]
MAFTYKPYEESEEVKKARQKLANIESQRPEEWTGGTYGTQLQDAYNRLQNREKFNYDFNADALYNQYKDQYMRQGLMAMQDTLAQSAALTGGFGNSYAASAGNMAYQNYLGKLNGVIPELRDMAFQQYQAEGDDLADNYDRLRGLYGTEYNEHQDRMNTFNNERNYLYNLAQDLAKDDYDRYNDEYARALNLYNMNNVSSGGRGGGNGGTDKEKPEPESPAAEPVTANAGLIIRLFGMGTANSLADAATKGNYQGIAKYLDEQTAAGTIDEATADAIYSFLKERAPKTPAKSSAKSSQKSGKASGGTGAKVSVNKVQGGK